MSNDTFDTAHTPGPWEWVIHDYSMASIEGRRGMEDHVLSISPCRNCQKGKTHWKFGRCTTPKEADARLIAAAPDLLAALVLARANLDDYDNGEREIIDAAISKATGRAV